MAAAGRLLPDVLALKTVDFLNGFNKKSIPFQSRPLLAVRSRTSRHSKPLIFLMLLIRNRYFFSPVRSWPLALGRPGSPNLFRCLCVCVAAGVSSPRNADPPNSPPRRCAAATVARLGNVWMSCLYAHSRFVCSVFIFQVVHIPGCSVLTSEGGKAGIGLNRNLFVKKFPPQGGGGSHRLNGSALARIERADPWMK